MLAIKEHARRLHRFALTRFHRRNIRWRERMPIVSFTFDDFPRSALTIAGPILEEHKARGTYYVAPHLKGVINQQGEHFHEEDLSALVSAGHELGSHTYTHLSCRSVSLKDYKRDVIKANEFIRALTQRDDKVSFAYPFGHVTLAAKQSIGALQSCCRGSYHGVNNDAVDLNLLRANQLYSDSVDFCAIERLVCQNARLQGWLIFYTHDVRLKPSPFGCTPSFFKRVVNCATKNGMQILTISEALEAIDGGSVRKRKKVLQECPAKEVGV